MFVTSNYKEMEVSWLPRALLISALCLCLVAEGCEKLNFPTFAYYNNGGTWTICSVNVTSCCGGCRNSYEHYAHLDSDYSDPAENSLWQYRVCSVKTSETSATACVPLTGGDQGWTVSVKHAKTCHCSSLTSGTGASTITLSPM